MLNLSGSKWGDFMVITNISACCLNKNQIIPIGRQLENNYRQIVFDCSGFGVEVDSITLVHQRSQDVAPYLVATSNTNSLTWTVTNTDTSFTGYGKAELRITFTNGLAKSAVFTTFVITSITADAVIPSALQSWYDAMIDYIDENTITEDDLEQAIADYIAEHPISAPVTSVNSKTGDVVLDSSDVGALPDSTVIPSKTSQLQNDSGFITSAPVTSVNNQTGDVTISVPTKTSELQNDSGFLTSAPVTSVNGQTGAVSISVPTKTSDLNNDSGFLTSAVTSFNGSTGAVTYTAPVTSVNGQTGAVTVTDTNTTYTISISGNVITLTPSTGTAQSITLPVYSGGIG